MINDQREPLVKNTSSKKQVDSAEQKERRLRLRDQEDLRFVLSDRRGRRFINKLLGECRTFQSIFETSSRIHYNSGQQDIGLKLVRECVVVDPEILGTLCKEQNEDNQ